MISSQLIHLRWQLSLMNGMEANPSPQKMWRSDLKNGVSLRVLPSGFGTGKLINNGGANVRTSYRTISQPVCIRTTHGEVRSVRGWYDFVFAGNWHTGLSLS